MTKAEYSALAVVAFFAGLLVWLLSRARGSATLRLTQAPKGGIAATSFDGQATDPSNDATVQQWAAATGINATWLAEHLGDAEQAAYDRGAPTDWEARGWPSPLGPWENPAQFFAGYSAIEGMV
jgi:hypothetical protein